MGDQKNRQRAGEQRISETLSITVDPETIEPCGRMVLLERMPEGRTAAGLVLPEGTRLRSRAKVHKVGPGHLCENGQRVGIGVKPGDLVILGPGVMAVPVGSTSDGNPLMLCEEGHIIAIDHGTHDPVLRVAGQALQ